MLQFLQPQGAFFDLFERLGSHVASSADDLLMFAQTYPADAGALERIRGDEHRADEVTHELLGRLDRNFQTPIDREDIHALAGDLDDIVDGIDAVAKRFGLFHVKAMEPAFVEQTKVLVAAAGAIKEAVPHLRDRKSWPDMPPHLRELHRLEKVGDGNHYSVLSRLFDGTHDIMFVIKWKELYDRIEAVIDGCADTGRTLRRIVLKNG